MNSENTIEYFQSQTQYLVEGESFWLWKEISDESPYSEEVLKKRYKWVQKNPGTMKTIGHIKLSDGENYPVCVQLSWVTIDGVYVCFYEATSRVVDHKMVEKFLEKEFPNVRKTDMMNFHHALNHIDKINKL